MSNFLRSLKQIGRITYLGREKIVSGTATIPNNCNYAVIYLNTGGTATIDGLEINKTELNGTFEIYGADAVSKITEITAGSLIYYKIL